MTLAHSLAWTGRGDDAVRHAETAMRLNPHGPWHYPLFAGFSYYMAKQFDKAITAFERVRRPRSSALAYQAAAYAQLGKMEEARTAREAYLKVSPRFSIRGWMKKFRMKAVQMALHSDLQET